MIGAITKLDDKTLGIINLTAKYLKLSNSNPISELMQYISISNTKNVNIPSISEYFSLYVFNLWSWELINIGIISDSEIIVQTMNDVIKYSELREGM